MKANGHVPRVTVATPYSEGSIGAIARAAAASAQLDAFFTTLYLSRHDAAARLFPTRKLRRRIRDAINRRSYPQIPPEKIRTVAAFIETIHTVSRRLPGGQGLATRVMYAGKRSFDRAVAERVGPIASDAVIAMMASAALTLKASQRSGGFGVLNFVNSHPFYQNLYLRELAGLSKNHHELIPDAVAKQVETELEIADLVLVPSRFVARQLLDLGVASGKVLVCRYGVDLSKFHPVRGAQLRRPTSVARCLYLGQIAHRKGVKVLLNAARQLSSRPIEFILVGPIVSPELLHDLPANVRWLGAIGHESAAEQMRLADLFVLPSLEDSYGLVTIEAMASGLPVVISDHAGTSELITDGQDGLVVPAGKITPLVEALERILDDPLLRERMAKAAMDRVQANGSWEHYGRSVLELIGGHLERNSKVPF